MLGTFDAANAVEAARVAELLGLKAAAEPRKYGCPVHQGTRSLHAYEGAGAGFFCWGACGRSYSNADLAAAVWGVEPIAAARQLVEHFGGAPLALPPGPRPAPRPPVAAPEPETPPGRSGDEIALDLKALRELGCMPTPPAGIYATVHAVGPVFATPADVERLRTVLTESFLPLELEHAGLWRAGELLIPDAPAVALVTPDALRWRRPRGGS